jgi:hypothetical protein
LSWIFDLAKKTNKTQDLMTALCKTSSDYLFHRDRPTYWLMRALNNVDHEMKLIIAKAIIQLKGLPLSPGYKLPSEIEDCISFCEKLLGNNTVSFETENKSQHSEIIPGIVDAVIVNFDDKNNTPVVGQPISRATDGTQAAAKLNEYSPTLFSISGPSLPQHVQTNHDDLINQVANLSVPNKPLLSHKTLTLSGQANPHSINVLEGQVVQEASKETAEKKILTWQ